MDLTELENYQKKFKNASALKIVDWAIDHFGTEEMALASAFGPESQILTDMLVKKNANIKIFSIDTGRLFQETYELMEQTRKKYNINIEVLFPEKKVVEDMVYRYGENLFYESMEKRKLCCNARKVQVFQQRVLSLKALMTGLRRGQSSSRGKLEKIEWDAANNLIKINPLVDWTTEQVWEYIIDNEIPYNCLHDKGYSSIGCAPCTRSVKPGEDIRSGRWWWEPKKDSDLECGLHVIKVPEVIANRSRQCLVMD